MNEQYETTSCGVIHQINSKIIDYNIDYVQQRYDSYGNIVSYMSYLRLGYIIGSIGRIPESILDVGYGNGSFLSVCKNIVTKCYGYDISTYPVPEGCHAITDDITSHKFDVVTFFDSLEHYENITFVQKLKCNFICISLPWCHNFDHKWFEEWKHRRPNEHLWHFNDSSLVCFMKEQGFSLINFNNIEDTIRKNNSNYPNILTGIFKNENSFH